MQRQRGDKLERSNAHLYETGGMRRTHLRGHANILKRLIVHAAGFNLGLLMRTCFGIGKPRTLQDAPRVLRALLGACLSCWIIRHPQCYRTTPHARVEICERLPAPASSSSFSALALGHQPARTDHRRSKDQG
ncbi:MAG: hypothetical protein IT445_12265 [Phycisphaeraceae bacterium]|nr:hypothetical protein [Phycisphaeraceae bacterium]